MRKKVLAIGGSGAIGTYLVPELINLGYAVDVVSLDDCISNNKDLTYTKADAKNVAVMSEILKKDYDAIIDFMWYKTRDEFETFLPLYLKNTAHYIFLSTYRVYADEEHPIRETSPRIYDVTKSRELLNSGDYCIYKAEAEDFLKDSGASNWTIIRPAITYSKRRFQLVTLEYDVVIKRMLEGKTILLPEGAMSKMATMSWAGDVGKMISRLVLNRAAQGQIYSVCTSECHSWEEIAHMYGRIGGLKYMTVDTDTFINVVFDGNEHCRRQLILDRYYDRIMDNTKILSITGMKQSELMPLEKGLAHEFANFDRSTKWPPSEADIRMDNFFLLHEV